MPYPTRVRRLGISDRCHPPPGWASITVSFWNSWARHISCIAAKNTAGTDTASTFGSLSGATKWVGGVLAPNGMIYGIPDSSTTVLKIDPATDTASTFGSLSGATKWAGGVLAPNGMIYGIPRDSTTVLKIDSGPEELFGTDVCLAGHWNKF